MATSVSTNLWLNKIQSSNSEKSCKVALFKFHLKYLEAILIYLFDINKLLHMNFCQIQYLGIQKHKFFLLKEFHKSHDK